MHHAGCRRTPAHLSHSRLAKAQLQTAEWGQRQQAAAHHAILAAAASNATPPSDNPNGASSADASASQPTEDADAARERRRSVWERAAQLHAERQVGPIADGERHICQSFAEVRPDCVHPDPPAGKVVLCTSLRYLLLQTFVLLSCSGEATAQNVLVPLQALAAQMAAVVADAEWLEPHERDAVQQLLRTEYTADAPPPPPPLQETQQPKRQQSRQELQGQQRSTAQGAPENGQHRSSNDAAAAEQRGLPLRPSDDVMEEPRRQAANAEAAAAGRQAGAEPGKGTAQDAVPPGVPAEAVRLLRCSACQAGAAQTPSNRCC